MAKSWASATTMATATAMVPDGAGALGQVGRRGDRGVGENVRTGCWREKGKGDSQMPV